MVPLEVSKLDVLKLFKLERILNEDPVTRSITLFGSFPRTTPSDEPTRAILKIEKTAFSADGAGSLCLSLTDTQLIESNDIYTWLFGWSNSSQDKPEFKINIVHPATEVHIRKYSKQEVLMVHETPDLFHSIVQPYIAAFPAARTQWVDDILSGKSESEKILHRDSDPNFGYVILPDMKWDLANTASLYLVAIALSKDIRCLRDLRPIHLDMLRSIRKEAKRIVKDRWGLAGSSLRLYVHYQPSYYHFHVHIVNANQAGFMSSTVGQAHLLDDVISLLELDVDDGPSIFERMTLTYGLGEQHGLFEQMKAVQPVDEISAHQ